MNSQLKELLKPEVLNTVNGLELVAKIIAEGFLSGSNRSQSIGVGFEFSQYRGYEPGDDLRLLDWKMFARSEKYFIKQSDIETNITVKFFLDASQSMDHKEGGLTKLQYAKALAAALAYLARKQSDTFGLYAINEDAITVVEPRFQQQQFIRFLNRLIQVKTHGRWANEKDLEALYRHVGKEMIVIFTDLYDHNRDLLQFIFKLKTNQNEVIVFHLIGETERTLDEEGIFTYEDLESGARVKVDTTLQQRTYQKKVNEWLERCRASLLEKHIEYQLVPFRQTPEMVLFRFLNSRKRLFR